MNTPWEQCTVCRLYFYQTQKTSNISMTVQANLGFVWLFISVLLLLLLRQCNKSYNDKDFGFIPMSLLKFPSLLSKFSWMKTSSTWNVCSRVGSVSLRAFFPRVTDRRRALVWVLERNHKKEPIETIPAFIVIFQTPAGAAVSDLSTHPSGKQWAAVRTQQGEIRLPPHRKTFCLDLLLQNMAAIHGCDSTVVTVPPTIFICFPGRWPHVDSVCGNKRRMLTFELKRKIGTKKQ